MSIQRSIIPRAASVMLLLVVAKAASFVGIWGRSHISGDTRRCLSPDDSDKIDLTFSRPSDEVDERMGNVNIPSTGLSVSDEMEAAQRDRFVTEVVPIKELGGVAQLVTSPLARGSFEPIRYLLSLSPPPKPSTSVIEEGAKTTKSHETFVMVDVPPYSPQLVTRMKAFMGINATLAAILVTNRDAIHYDQPSGVFSNRKPDLTLWKQVFPELEIVAYRLDIPRDCRASVTQVLDGYGPFGLDQQAMQQRNQISFVETGRPLTYEEWDHDLAEEILRGQTPPDDNQAADTNNKMEYSPEAIRSREQGKLILAIYTPGHSFGSVSYVFPAHGICCSGNTIPVEDTRAEENLGIGDTGPTLDCRGYITTNKAGIARQMQSAKALVDAYSDRFHVVLPASGGPLLLDGDSEERKLALTEILDQYQRIGEIYERLGITSDCGEDDS